MLYLSNHSYLWTIVNSVLLVAKGREIGRQHDLLFLFLLFVGGSGGSGGAAPRVAPRSGPGGGCGCTVRVPTRSRPLKKSFFVVTSAVLRIRDVHILDPGSAFFHLGSRIQGPKQGGYKEMSSTLLTNSALVYEGGSCGVPANEYSCAQ
jgi:hypothetical protein